jgi:hypothetical protein
MSNVGEDMTTLDEEYTESLLFFLTRSHESVTIFR